MVEEVTVDGGITMTGEKSILHGVYEVANGAAQNTITVEQDISVTSEGTNAYVYGFRNSASDDGSKAEATVGGDITATGSTAHGVYEYAADGGSSTVVVENGVSASSQKGFAQGIHVDARGEDNEATVRVEAGGVVAEGGNPTNAVYGIYTSIESQSTGTVDVTGDVNAKGEDSVGIFLSESGGGADVLVDGTVSGEGKTVRIEANENEDGSYNAGDVLLTAWEIKANDGADSVAELVVDGEKVDQSNEKAAETLKEAIQYIIRRTEAIELSEDTQTYTDDQKTEYKVAHEDDDVAFSVNLNEGDELDGIYYNADQEETLVKAEELNKRDDGSFLLKMLRGGAMLLGMKFHTHAGEAVKENEIATRPGVKGSFDEAVYCTVCKEELSRNTVEIDALPTEAPIEQPTEAPTEAPTVAPTEAPTVAPTLETLPTLEPVETVEPTGIHLRTPGRRYLG